MNTTPLLSLSIPIYNRLQYLERQLTRFIEDKDLFEEQIQLTISDNCSEEDLRSCCERFQNQGLRLIYHRNDANIGPDGNFKWCFYHAEGKYVWLLGSDDILVKGFLRKLLKQLQKGNYGLVHLSMKPIGKELVLYYDHGEMLTDVSFWITYMSANIICTNSLKTVDLSAYLNSFMIQVPAYLNACLTSDINALLYFGYPFEKDSDASNNGGYNIFQVFIVNLFGIYQNFIENGMLSQKSFEKIKKKQYKNFIAGVVLDLLLLKKPKRKNFDTTNAWSILRKHYGRYLYAYYYIIQSVLRRFAKKVVYIFRKD